MNEYWAQPPVSNNFRRSILIYDAESPTRQVSAISLGSTCIPHFAYRVHILLPTQWDSQNWIAKGDLENTTCCSARAQQNFVTNFKSSQLTNPHQEREEYLHLLHVEYGLPWQSSIAWGLLGLERHCLANPCTLLLQDQPQSASKIGGRHRPWSKIQHRLLRWLRK